MSEKIFTNPYFIIFDQIECTQIKNVIEFYTPFVKNIRYFDTEWSLMIVSYNKRIQLAKTFEDQYWYFWLKKSRLFLGVGEQVLSVKVSEV